MPRLAIASTSFASQEEGEDHLKQNGSQRRDHAKLPCTTQHRTFMKGLRDVRLALPVVGARAVTLRPAGD